MLREEKGRTIGVFRDLLLGSHFQPIFSLAHRRIVGFEALLRATDNAGRPRGPLEVFGCVTDRDDTVLLDRLCRTTHMRNFSRYETGESWLFLNINPQVIVSGVSDGFLQRELARLQFPPHRIVIEILEAALQNDAPLAEAVAYYRDLGCLIAIDDFGAGHSNFDRICRLRPDIVKLDRSIVMQAALDKRIGAIMPGMVSLLHESGSLVVMEGIETEREAMVAMDADADLVQGYFFARPAPDALLSERPVFADLFDQFQNITASERGSYRSEIAPYINGIGYTSVLLQSNRPLEVACRGFLELPRAERCFLLDGNGSQIDNNFNAPHAQVASDPRFAPLKNARGANWSRRHYFRRAIARPERVQVTRPYLSAANAMPCVTVSIAFKVNGELRILCGDILWNQRFSTMDQIPEFR
jgi:EAL domain-containing protein (putative c-di-GMP-specific phosphodiesterase class I)